MPQLLEVRVGLLICFSLVCGSSLSTAGTFPITVNNPSFETVPTADLMACTGGPCTYFNVGLGSGVGLIPGWTMSSESAGGQYIPDGTKISPEDGTVVAYSTGGQIAQVVGPTAVPGDTYTLTVWLGVDKTGPPPCCTPGISETAYIAIGTNPSGSGVATTVSGEWTEWTWTYTAVGTDAGRAIVIVLQTYGSLGYFDNVSLSYTTPSPIVAVSVTPNSGSGTGPDTFNAMYTDGAGASDLQAVYLDFGAVGFATHDCIAVYVQGANQLYLFQDNNSGTVGPVTLGGGGSVSNSQCTLFGGSTTATASGNNLTVPFTVQFLAGYGGLKQMFILAQNYNGASSGGGVPNDAGTWTPATSTASVRSVSPGGGTGLGPKLFKATYDDTGGANDFQAVYLDFGSVGFAAHNCIAVYVPGPNTLYLFTDDNSSALGPIAEGAGGGSISNSQCTLSSGTTPVTYPAVYEMTVPFNITFLAGYGGLKQIFALAQTYAGTSSGGGVPNDMGTWEPQTTTPSAVSVNPNSGGGLGPQQFSAVYSDTGGTSDLQVVYLSFSASTFLAGNSCNVGYEPGNNSLFLLSDDNSTAFTVGEGLGGSVSNTQCTLSGGSTAASSAGDSLTVPFTITFKGGFTGSKTVFGLAQTYDGTASGVVTLGTWTP